jgi:hypothetical protein
MGDQHDALAGMSFGDALQRSLDTCVKPAQRLAAARQLEVGLAGTPARERLTHLRVELIRGKSLELPIVPLAQTRLPFQGQPSAMAIGSAVWTVRVRSLEYTTAIVLAAASAASRLRHLLRLSMPLVGQRDVDLALEAPLSVPVGDPVPDQQQLGPRRGGGDTAASIGPGADSRCRCL